MRALFTNAKLHIADIGATGGPELRWKEWTDLLFFHTFDPDPRAHPWDLPSQNHPVGLWSEKCSKELTLTRYPPATSLFPPNAPFVARFFNADGFESVGKEMIALETLDALLADEPIDFLKVDAEGAELEILKGSEKVLAKGCLGFQVEVCFAPLRVGAPTFADVERFASKRGFALFQLEREHWMRKNRLCSFDSSPQLIWANALFLLPKERFLQKLEQCATPDLLLAKYCLILHAYHLYDYAYEICEEVGGNAAQMIQESLRQTVRREKSRPIKIFCSLMTGGVRYLLTLSPDKRRHRLCYLRRRVRELGKVCLFWGRNGYALYD